MEDTSTFPAEFEHHKSIWLAWPTYDIVKDYPSTPVFKCMIKEIIQRSGTVSLLVQNEEEKLKVFQDLDKTFNHISTLFLKERVHFYIIPHSDIWMRDFGPIFLCSKNRKEILQFDWNDWGYNGHFKEFDSSYFSDGNISSTIAKAINTKYRTCSMVSEGGNREFNGKGVLMLCEAVEKKRNPNLSKEKMESILKDAFHVKKIIWLKEGLEEDRSAFIGKLNGDLFNTLTTGGHIDEFARFVSPNRILLASVPEEEHDNSVCKVSHQRMEENYEILKNSTDQDGNPFEIVRIPLPPLIIREIGNDDEIFKVLKNLKFEDGTIIENSAKIIAASSYCNFLVTNHLVLIPKYYKEGRSEVFKQRDEEAKNIIQSCFPEREVVQLDCEIFNLAGGGMHCMSQQEPYLECEESLYYNI